MAEQTSRPSNDQALPGADSSYVKIPADLRPRQESRRERAAREKAAAEKQQPK